MYALRNKLDGKLMSVEPHFREIWHKWECIPEKEISLLIIPQDSYNKTIFVTHDKGTAYQLAKNGSVDRIKVKGGYEVKVVKLREKRASHRKIEK